MTSSAFDEIERRLVSLLGALSTRLSSEERLEVAQFIDAGEYGLALETLGGLLVEERKPLPLGAFEEIEKLAHEMGIQASVLSDELKMLVETM